jgi:chromosome partitioning protein
MQTAMTRVIAVMNQKDGVGKTTTVINLGHALAMLGKKTVLLDLDPKGDIALGLGVQDFAEGLDDVMLNDSSLEAKLIDVRDNLQVVVAGNKLADYEQLKTGGLARGYKLKQVIEQSLLNKVDYVLIDCTSKAGLLGLNAMFAADEVLIPISTNYVSLQGLSQLLYTLKRAQALANKEILVWLASTRIQVQRKLTERIKQLIAGYFPGHVLHSIVEENGALAESLSLSQSIFDYKSNSKSADDYHSLALDLVSGRAD